VDAVSGETAAQIAALGAVGGALVGVTGGGVVDFVLDRLREGRDARVGARLVRLDLAVASDQLQSAERDGKWWVFFNTTMSGWEAHKTSLAARLQDDDFEAVTQAVAELGRFGVDMQRAPLEPNTTFRLVDAAPLHAMRVNATTAHTALAKLAKQKPVEGLLPDD
jgi:hypothetical protein